MSISAHTREEVIVMGVITLTNHKTELDCIEVGDADSDAARIIAGKMFIEGYTFDKALVDRHDGLVLIGREGAWRFRCANCGYGGTGPITAAKILATFGFGDEKVIFDQIKHGGDAAKATFYR